MLPPTGAKDKYALNHSSCPHMFSVVELSEALGLCLYSNTVVMSMSNSTVLGSLEPHQWCTWPSAYNLLYRLVGKELHQLTVWLILHIISLKLPTPTGSISHPLIRISTGIPTDRHITISIVLPTDRHITVSTVLPTYRDIIACHVKY